MVQESITQRQIRALLVDDHALFRESVSKVLSTEPDLKVDHCASIREALEMLARGELRAAAKIAERV